MPSLLAAVVAGLGYGLALPHWPGITLAPLAWVMLVPLLGRRAAGWSAGTFIRASVVFALVGSLVGGIWVFGPGLALGAGAVLWHTANVVVPLLVYRLVLARFGHGRALAVLPAIWAVWDWGAAQAQPFFWAALGSSQAGLPWLAQIADLGGLWGLTLFVATVNVLAVQCLDRRGFGRMAAGLALALLFGAASTYGLHRLEADPSDAVSLRLALVRSGVDAKGVPSTEAALALARDAQSLAPDLIVWPESLFPRSPFYDDALSARIAALTAPLLIQFIELDDPFSAKARQYATARLLSPQAPAEGPMARKRKLIPMTELRILPDWFANWMFENHNVWFANLSMGDSPMVLELPGKAKIGVLQCYEVAFPFLAADQVRAGAGILAIPANDSGYGPSEPRQALAFAQLRAIETRRPVVRATTLGPLAVIDRFGRVMAEDDGHVPALLTAEVVPHSEPTLYVENPNLVPAAGCLFIALTLLPGLFRLRAQHGGVGGKQLGQTVPSDEP